MSFTKQGISVGLVAGGDLSGSQYRFVKLNGSGQVVAVAAITDLPIGVLQNAPKAGEHAEVMLHGVSPLKAVAAGLAHGAKVGPSAVGRGQAAVATQNVCGQVIKAAPATEDAEATVYVNCSGGAVVA